MTDTVQIADCLSVSRRSFLRGALAVAACATVSHLQLPGPIPKIIGDGKHDDGPGLNALFAGKPVSIEGEGVQRQGGRIVLEKGFFMINETVRVNTPETYIEHCAIFSGPDLPKGAPAMHIENDCSITVNRCIFTNDVTHTPYQLAEEMKKL